jgi:hypothetical protein
MRYLSVILFVLFSTSCEHLGYLANKNQITKIEFASGECYGHCQQIALSIDSTLTFNYYGGRNATLKGYYSGTISEAVWDTLNRSLDAIYYKGQTDGRCAIDDQAVELIIYQHNKAIHINCTLNDLPDSTKKIILQLKSISGSIKLRHIKETLKFETTYQNQDPPHPKLKQIKFPPPNNNKH